MSEDGATASGRPIQPGERAPGFLLRAINREGSVSLEDFRGRHAFMLSFFRGLHCPFCRRQIASLGAAQPALLAVGVETVAVVNTPSERADLYFRYRPTPVTLLSDPDCRSHQAFGIRRIQFVAAGSRAPSQWPAQMRPEDFAATRVDPTGELGQPTHPMAANDILNKQDGFELTAVDREIFAAHGTQFAGQFLIDLDGIVRWAWTEAPNSPSELCRFPGREEMVAAARELAVIQTRS